MFNSLQDDLRKPNDGVTGAQDVGEEVGSECHRRGTNHEESTLIQRLVTLGFNGRQFPIQLHLTIK